MGILQKLKAALGMDSGGRSRQRTEPDVTVEHEPSTETERAVKTDVDAEPDAPSEVESTTAGVDDEPDTSAADADGTAAGSEADDTEGAAESPPVEDITGIGATYADRLTSAGIETVADLADSDVATVVEAAQATESRAEDWLEQARDR